MYSQLLRPLGRLSMCVRFTDDRSNTDSTETSAPRLVRRREHHRRLVPGPPLRVLPRRLRPCALEITKNRVMFPERSSMFSKSTFTSVDLGGQDRADRRHAVRGRRHARRTGGAGARRRPPAGRGRAARSAGLCFSDTCATRRTAAEELASAIQLRRRVLRHQPCSALGEDLGLRVDRPHLGSARSSPAARGAPRAAPRRRCSRPCGAPGTPPASRRCPRRSSSRSGPARSPRARAPPR